MIKINMLRREVNKKGLKLSATTSMPEINKLVSQIVDMACEEAHQQGSPKLEGKHFKWLKTYTNPDKVYKKLMKAKTGKGVKKRL